MSGRPGDGVDQVSKKISNKLVKPVLVRAADLIGAAMAAAYTHKKSGGAYIVEHDVKKAKGKNEVRILVGPPRAKYYMFFQDVGFQRGGKRIRTRAGKRSVTRHIGLGVKVIPGTHQLKAAALAMHGTVEEFLRVELALALQKTIKGKGV